MKNAPQHLAACLAVITALTGCTQTGPAADVSEPAVALTQAADGRCWASETTPAVYEQVMGQVQVIQEQRNDQGEVVQPPIYRNSKVPKLVTPRGEIRFEAPCPSAVTPEFIATLQRAMYARGYLQGSITGTLDAQTRSAIQRFQSERGLDSAQLSMDTARELGLIAVPRAPAQIVPKS